MNKKAPGYLCCVIVALIFSVTTITSAQQKATRDSAKSKSATRRMIDKGIGLISTSPEDTIQNEESTDNFEQYKGKVIRSITVTKIGFEKSIYDSTKKTKKIITDLANFIHTPSKEKTIRNHLFIRVGETLNPYRVADNERFLRDQNFIMDSRIVVSQAENSEDSVDIVVITRDVVSLGFRLGGSFPTSTKFSIYDANFLGGGQRLQFDGLVDVDRIPRFGYGGYFRKSSFMGSLANVEVGYSQLNQGRSYGIENEFAYFFRIDRPLVSPYSRLAGSFEWSNNWSENVYQEPDSTFLDYNYTITDAWIGYNIGIHRIVENRNRHFLAVRFLNGSYLDKPEQPEYEESVLYNDIKGVLGEYTFYRQNFFKTRYIYGFGRTEDVPYGISTSVSLGYLRTFDVFRPYVGYKLRYGAANERGNFFVLSLQMGSFVNDQHELEDGLINAQANYYTKAYNIGRYKMRSLISGGIATLQNRVARNLIEIDQNVIHGFSVDSIMGDQRISGQWQAVLYTPWQLLGFRFAPFVGVDWANMSCRACDEATKNIFGFNAGFRTRNENLIFGTIEVRGTYVPDDGFGESQFYFEFKQNLRIKNSGRFAGPPTVVTSVQR